MIQEKLQLPNLWAKSHSINRQMLSDYDLLPSFQFLLLKQSCTYFSLERTPFSSKSLARIYTKRNSSFLSWNTWTLCPTLPCLLAGPPGKVQAEGVVRALSLVLELGLEHFLKQVKLTIGEKLAGSLSLYCSTAVEGTGIRCFQPSAPWFWNRSTNCDSHSWDFLWNLSWRSYCSIFPDRKPWRQGKFTACLFKTNAKMRSKHTGMDI